MIAAAGALGIPKLRKVEGRERERDLEDTVIEGFKLLGDFLE
jgi:hypothetical protein